MAKRISLYVVHSFSTSPNLCQCTTVLNADVPNCHIKKFNRENVKFGLKFSVWATKTSGLMGVSSQNLFQATCPEVGVIKWYNFWKPPPPLKFGTAKKRPKFCAISNNFRLWSRIRNGSTYRKSEEYFINYNPLPRLVKKKLVNFGPQTKTF